MRVFHLYRQRLPAAAPQAVQILATCHALAVAGAEVTLLADRGEGDRSALLAHHGLSPHDGLRLQWLASEGRTLAGLEWRARLASWALGGGVLLSRRVDYAAALLRFRQRSGARFQVVHEWHYIASANAREAGRAAEAEEADEAVVRDLADGHVAVCRALAASLEGARGPIRVIPNGGPPPRPGARPERPRVVYAGLFRRAQDLDALWAAVRQLDVDVVVVGGDESGERLAEARSRAGDLGDRVRFTGALTPEGAREVLRSGTVAVATFADSVNMRQFACPLKVLEAQAAGIPLVVSDFPTVRELVDDDTAVLVPPGDGEALAAGIRRVLGDGALAQGLSMRGLEVAARRTWAARGRALHDFLAELA